MKIDSPDSAQLPALRALWKTAFHDSDEWLDLFFTIGFCPDRCRCVTVDGSVAAVLYWFDTRVDTQRFAYLYAVATDPDHRNKGFCRALMRDTLAHLQKSGYAGALLVPENEDLAKMYASMGFSSCTKIREFSCCAKMDPVTLREISSTEYTRQRNKFLPVNGVIQDGADLALLAATTRFFRGEDFLLAASTYDGFRGVELLGNTNAAPGILRAMGVEEGTFRTPGSEIPFAMLCPLVENCVLPSYFGFALD